MQQAERRTRGRMARAQKAKGTFWTAGQGKRVHWSRLSETFVEKLATSERKNFSNDPLLMADAFFSDLPPWTLVSADGAVSYVPDAHRAGRAAGIGAKQKKEEEKMK